MPNLAAAPVLAGAELAVEDAEPEAALPAAAVLEGTVLVCIPELAATEELLGAAEALALALALALAALALADALAVALAAPVSISAPSTTLAVRKPTSLPDRTAVTGSSPVNSAVQVIVLAPETKPSQP